MNIYNIDLEKRKSSIPLEIVETDIDLYYHMAFSLYIEVEKNNSNDRDTVVILPVGPVFQYRRFVFLCEKRRLDLSRLYCFFMDEYLDDNKRLISAGDPLSFRGFIDREFMEKMPGEMGLKRGNIFFPSPDNPGEYDGELSKLGNADVCFAGVGINGHLAFNEPFPSDKAVSSEEFGNLGTRVVKLTRETITINSNTAMRGAYEKIPEYAVTVGFNQILNSKKIMVYLNRPWQSSVVRKMLFGEKTASFPASLLRDHPDVQLILTRTVSLKPDFTLR
jgi:glucosamine-6-phosphate deaminase